LVKIILIFLELDVVVMFELMFGHSFLSGHLDLWEESEVGCSLGLEVLTHGEKAGFIRFWLYLFPFRMVLMNSSSSWGLLSLSHKAGPLHQGSEDGLFAGRIVCVQP
jgi:hypothetical protein